VLGTDALQRLWIEPGWGQFAADMGAAPEWGLPVLAASEAT